MILFRYLTAYLRDFFNSRKTALLLTGARQTEKTFAIRQLGKKFTSFIVINFIESPVATNIFKEVNSAEEIY